MRNSSVSSNSIRGHLQFLIGKWRNELGSSMTIEQVSESGIIKGYYQTNTGNPLPYLYERFKLEGQITESFISFTVDFSQYQTLTNWIGEYRFCEHGPKLCTEWSLIFQDQAKYKSIFHLSGKNNFHKVA